MYFRMARVNLWALSIAVLAIVEGRLVYSVLQQIEMEYVTRLW